MTDLVVFGVAGAFWVKIIVNLLKKAGLAERLAIPAALVVGIALAVCAQIAGTNAGFATWFGVVVGGVTAALVAMDLYDVTRAVAEIRKT